MKKKTLNKLQEQYKKDYQWQHWIKLEPKNKPYVDQALATVQWGTDDERKSN